MGVALKNPARLNPPPTEADTQLARESSRRLGPTLNDLVVQNGSSGTKRAEWRSVYIFRAGLREKH